MPSAHDVAAYILKQHGPMTAMKLQKLVYYCQAWFTLVLGAIEKGKLPVRVLELAESNRKAALAERDRIVLHAFGINARSNP